MGNNKLLSLSIIILAISIVFSSIWVGYSLEKFSNGQMSNTQVSKEKALLTEKESAEYLNISIDQFKNILLKDSQEKVGLTSYNPYKFLPYIKISNEDNMFSKKELDEWIKYNMLNK